MIQTTHQTTYAGGGGSAAKNGFAAAARPEERIDGDERRRLETPHRATPQPVGRQQQLRRGADVRERRVLEGQPDAANDAAHPRQPPQDEPGDAADHPGEARREEQREREHDDRLADHEREELERMGRGIADDQLHEEHLRDRTRGPRR